MPDLDSLLYTLAGLIDEKRGWGRDGESWNALASAAGWGGEDWFRLGDRDIGLHLVRTEMLNAGVPLSRITAHLVERVRVGTQILPATDDRLRTRSTRPPARSVPGWFVARNLADEMEHVSYDGAPEPRPAPGARDPRGTDAIILAPSNPYLSTGRLSPCPRSVRRWRPGACVALPSARRSAGRRSQARWTYALAHGWRHYTEPCNRLYLGLIDALVVDQSDAPSEPPVELVITRR